MIYYFLLFYYIFGYSFLIYWSNALDYSYFSAYFYFYYIVDISMAFLSIYYSSYCIFLFLYYYAFFDYFNTYLYCSSFDVLFYLLVDPCIFDYSNDLIAYCSSALFLLSIRSLNLKKSSASNNWLNSLIYLDWNPCSINYANFS